MASLEEIFAKEFNQMVKQRSANSSLDLFKVPLPPSVLNKSVVNKNNLVYIKGINDEYYGKLNKTEAILLSRPNLRRRKFDSKGEFLKDENDNFITVDVDVPHSCVAIVSDEKIGVPLKYKTKESFMYVDIVTKEKDGNTKTKYIYILPKEYCYKLNQVALVFSLHKLKSYYEGASVYFQNGYQIYLYIIPYKPSNTVKNYRVISTKTAISFKEDIDTILEFWLKSNFIFNSKLTSLSEPIGDRENLSFKVFNGVLDTYERYNPMKSLADVSDDLDDLD